MKLPKSKLKLTLLAAPVAFLGAVVLCGICQYLFHLPEQDNLGLVRLYAGFNWTFVILCAQILFLMPAIEEVIFRLPTRWIKHPAFAVGTSIAFVFAHYPDWALLAQKHEFVIRPLDNAFLGLFFFALVQCWLYRRTKAIWCPMLNHSIFNATNLILLFVLPK